MNKLKLVAFSLPFAAGSALVGCAGGVSVSNAPAQPVPGAAVQTAKTAGGGSVYVLRYGEGTPSSAVRKAVSASGASLLGPLSGRAYLVRANAAQVAELGKSDAVSSLSPYAASEKGTAPASGAAPAIYVVTPFPDADTASVRAAIASLGGCEVLSAAGDPVIRVRMGAAGFKAVAGLPDVRAISPWFEPKILSSGKAK